MKAKISETVLDEHLADLSNQGMDDAQYAEYMAQLAQASGGSAVPDVDDRVILDLMDQGLSDAEILAALDLDGDNIDDQYPPVNEQNSNAVGTSS